MKNLLLFLCTLSLGPFGAAQKAPPAQPTISILAGRLLDVRTQKALPNQLIIIRGDKIVDVSPATASAVAEARREGTVIDLSTSDVFPGLIDCHSHLLMTYDSREPEDVNMILT